MVRGPDGAALDNGVRLVIVLDLNNNNKHLQTRKLGNCHTYTASFFAAQLDGL